MKNRRTAAEIINKAFIEPVEIELNEGLLEEFEREGFHFLEDHYKSIPRNMIIEVSKDFRDVAEKLILQRAFPIYDFLSDDDFEKLEEEYMQHLDEYLDLTEYILHNYILSELDFILDPQDFGWDFNINHNLWYCVELIF